MYRIIIIYFKMVSVALRGQMAHRASFLMLITAYFISTFVDIIGIWVLFYRFQTLNGWTLEQMALIYSVIHMGFSIAESTGRGFDNFNLQVKNGEFDRLLLRPINPLIQIAASGIQLMRLGRFLQAFVILLWACFQLNIGCFSWIALAIACCVIATSSLFYGLLILQATLAFWTTETLEMMNVLTFGGVESGQYPMSIYNIYFRNFFTFIVPLSCVAYYPIAALLGLDQVSLWVGYIAPLAGIFFLLISTRIWSLGVSRYQSAGG